MSNGQEMVGCGNCGHAEPMTKELAEVSFKWLDTWTTKTSCQACGSYVIMRTWAVNAYGLPIGGEMLVVKTSLHSKGDRTK
ncbi:hypothetical protein [Paenibacillus sinopodophylli]|uniref:hypothetical protein n=1 Tax=Paenibacillus sinopodophylli TaxID=1837342 RepID=UPI00110CD711|nr:hypothetical protein [Paenibacillus sinopodophylli]